MFNFFKKLFGFGTSLKNDPEYQEILKKEKHAKEMFNIAVTPQEINTSIRNIHLVAKIKKEFLNKRKERR